MIFNEFCAAKDCRHYVEWNYAGTLDEPTSCISCKLVGESHNIDKIPMAPHVCPHLEEIKEWKLSQTKLDEGLSIG